MDCPANWSYRVVLSTFCTLACLLFSPLPSGAEIFRYVDRDGVIHFTNIPTFPNSQRMPAGFQNMAPNYRPTYTRYNPSIPPRASLPSCNTANRNAFDPYIKLSCQRYGMDHNLVKAVIHAESAFNPQAVSPKGAMGLMQLMPDTSKDMGVMDPFDPYDNIEGGTRYLRMLLNRFNNDVRLALAAYNAGPETVQKYGGIPPYEETETYVERVLALHSRYTR